jgi:hypothetical protein
VNPLEWFLLGLAHREHVGRLRGVERDVIASDGNHLRDAQQLLEAECRDGDGALEAEGCVWRRGDLEHSHDVFARQGLLGDRGDCKRLTNAF